MPTWTQDALELWNDLVAEFGAVATYGAFTFQCIKNPVRSAFQMVPNGYNDQGDTIIDLLRTDAVTNGLYALVQHNPQTKRPVIEIRGSSYDIIKMENDDDEQPSIRLSAMKHQ